MDITNEISNAKAVNTSHSNKNTPFIAIAFILGLALIGMTVFSLKYFGEKAATNGKEIKNIKNQLSELQEKYTTTLTKLTETQQALSYIEDVSCATNPASVEIKTKDEKYYLYRYHGGYNICDITNTEHPVLLINYESKIQSGNILVLTEYGDKMFVADLTNKTLKYINPEYFADIEQYINNEGKNKMYLFGPKEEDLSRLSPQNDKVIFGAASCHDCATVIKYYVYDFVTNKVTPLGYSDSSIKWLDNTKVQWNDLIIRELTADECKDPAGCMPFTTESTGIKTKIIN